MVLRKACRLLVSAIVPACLAQPVVPEGPAAWWSFEDAGSATTADVTGHGHDLALVGVCREPGAMGQALSFAGANSAVQAPLAEDLQAPAAVTLEAWARPDAIPPGSEGLGLLSLGNVLLRITRETPSFHVFTDQWGPILADGTVRLGQGYHLVGSYDGREMRIYVNGELTGVRERTGRVARCDRPLMLGRQANPFIGLIDEGKVYTRCLSAEEVAAAFAAGVARLRPGLSPGTLRYPGEAWSEAGWRAHELPAALAPFAGPRWTRSTGRPGASLGAVAVGIDPAMAEPLRTACMLRLVALCESQGITGDALAWPGAPGPTGRYPSGSDGAPQRYAGLAQRRQPTRRSHRSTRRRTVQPALSGLVQANVYCLVAGGCGCPVGGEHSAGAAPRGRRHRSPARLPAPHPARNAAAAVPLAPGRALGGPLRCQTPLHSRRRRYRAGSSCGRWPWQGRRPPVAWP